MNKNGKIALAFRRHRRRPDSGIHNQTDRFFGLWLVHLMKSIVGVGCGTSN